MGAVVYLDQASHGAAIKPLVMGPGLLMVRGASVEEKKS